MPGDLTQPRDDAGRFDRKLPEARRETRRVVRQVAKTVARAERLPTALIMRPVGRRARGARLLAAYLAATVKDVGKLQLSEELGIARSGIQRALGRIEDRRENPRFDQYVSRLEERLNA
jgi:hypothetical protein